MAIQLWVGRAGTGKTYKVAEALSALSTTGQRGWWIVPEQFSLDTERRLAVSAGGTGLTGVDVLTFHRLAYRILNEAGKVPRKYVNQAERMVAASLAVQNAREQLSVLRGFSARRGSSRIVCGMLSEISRYGVSPEMIQEAAAHIGNTATRMKITDLSVILEALQTLIHSRRDDPEADMNLLAEQIAGSAALEGVSFFFDGYASFSPQELNVIEQLARRGCPVVVTLTMDPVRSQSGKHMFHPTSGTAAELREIAARAGTPLEVIAFEGSPRRFGNDDLRHLEYALDHYRVPAKQAGGGICLYEAADPFDEAENAAARMVALARETACRWSDMAVAVPSLDAWRGIFSDVFRRWGIPFFMDNRRRILDHGITVFLTSAIEIIRSGWKRDPVMRFLKTGLTGADAFSADLCDNYILWRGLRGSDWTGSAIWEVADRDPEFSAADMEKLSVLRSQIVPPVRRLEAALSQAGTLKQCAAALYQLFCDFSLAERLAERSRMMALDGDAEAAEMDRQVWGMLMQTLDAMAAFGEAPAPGISGIEALLHDVLSEFTAGIAPPLADQVTVGEISRMRVGELKHMMILGTEEGHFPRSSVREGILTDADRLSLMDAGVRIAPDTRAQAFDHPYLAYMIFTRASESLMLSFSAADLSGQSRRPASVISRMKHIFSGLHTESGMVRRWMEVDEGRVQNIDGILPQIPVLLRRQAETGRTSLWLAAVLKWVHEQEPERFLRLAGAMLPETDQPLREATLKKLWNDNPVLSPTRMERYVVCPFAGFAEHGLKLQERREAAVKNPEIGKFMHEALYRIFHRLDAEHIRLAEAAPEMVRELAGRVGRELSEELFGTLSGARTASLLRRLTDGLVRAVDITRQHMAQTRFVPEALEAGFGDKGKYPPVTLDLPDGRTVSVAGRIDRVDTFEAQGTQWLRIIDYKSGHRVFSLDEVYYGLQTQMFVYLDAVMQGHPDAVPAGVLYFRLDDPWVREEAGAKGDVEALRLKEMRMKGIVLAEAGVVEHMDTGCGEGASVILPVRMKNGEVSGSAATREQFVRLQRHIRKLLTSVAEKMVTGHVEVSPARIRQNNPCDFCKMGHLCRVETGAGRKERFLPALSDDEVHERIRISEADHGVEQ